MKASDRSTASEVPGTKIEDDVRHWMGVAYQHWDINS